MKCPVCNKSNKTDTAICIHCGAKLPLKVFADEKNRNTLEKYKLFDYKKILIIIISFFSIALIVFILLLFSKPMQQKKESGGFIISEESTQTQDKNRTEVKVSTKNNNVSLDHQNISITDNKIAKAKFYRVRIRQKPDNYSTIIDHLPKDEKVYIISKSDITKIRIDNKIQSGYWYKVRWIKILENNQTKIIEGWVWSDLLIVENN